MNPHNCPKSAEPVFLEWNFTEGEFGDLVYRMASATCPHCKTRYLRIVGYVKTDRKGVEVCSPLPSLPASV